MVLMLGAQKENIMKPDKPHVAPPARPRLRDLPAKELLQAVELLREEVKRGRLSEGEVLEDVPLNEDASDEALQAQIDTLQEQLELENRLNDLDRRVVNLGLLKRANEAPRCSHVKSNGKPCRAPAWGARSFCVFHARALETHNGPGMNVKVLED